MSKKNVEKLENLAFMITRGVGSVWSVIVHTILFLACFVFILLGADLNKVLLILTTIVSLEAIYLSIFIQMSVNQQARSIANVEKDIDEIQEDVEEIAEDVEDIHDINEEIQEDIEEIQKDMDEIQEDVEEIQKDVDEITEEEIK